LNPTPARFIQDALENRVNQAILHRLPALGLPDAWLVAGCLFQTIWNLRSGLGPEHGIKDYDVFYFDATDLSAEAEAGVQARVQACCADLGVEIEVKNQSRVHTWYADYFGYPYPALTSSRDGLQRFLVACTCVGLQPAGTDGPLLFAPNGLDDLYAGILRPNPLCERPPLFEQKSLSYQARWPWLRIEA
jgi:uncharacterized protein